MSPYHSACSSSLLESFSWHGCRNRIILFQDTFQKTFLSRGKLRTRGIISPRWQKSTFFKAEYETKWLVKWDFVCGRQTECEKAAEEASVRDGVSGSGSWNAALGCEECWYVAPTNIQSRRAADPLWNVCVCVCVCVESEHIIRPAAARRPNNRPRTHTNRNTSQREQKPQITKGGVLGRPGVRFQSCRLAAERLEALLETNPFAWTVSKKKQCAVFRPLDKGGWTMLYKKKKKRCSWRSNAQPVDIVSSLVWELTQKIWLKDFLLEKHSSWTSCIFFYNI